MSLRSVTFATPPVLTQDSQGPQTVDPLTPPLADQILCIRRVKGYLRIVQDFAQHFHQPPDKLGPEQLRQYQAHLFQDKKLNAGTVQQYVAALRFFFNKTLKRRYPLD
jgi:hypothetical protein